MEVAMCELLFALLLLGAIVAAPIVLLGLMIKLAFGLVALPVKLLGALVHAGLGALVLSLKVAVGLIGFFVALALLVIIVPLVPLLIVAGFFWIVVKLFVACLA
jgi:hypothetical protein